MNIIQSWKRIRNAVMANSQEGPALTPAEMEALTGAFGAGQVAPVPNNPIPEYRTSPKQKLVILLFLAVLVGLSWLATPGV